MQIKVDEDLPNQVVQLLRDKGYSYCGFTTVHFFWKRAYYAQLSWSCHFERSEKSLKRLLKQDVWQAETEIS